MTKLKVFLLLLLGILLTLFALENWHYPQPAVKLFGVETLPLPLSLIIYGCLLLGFLSGWLAHALKIRKQKRAAAAPKPASTPE